MRTRIPIIKKSAVLPLPIALTVSGLAGLVFVLALAPYGIWGVALLSPLLLYALLLGDIRPWRAFITGWVYGFGLWAAGAFWLYHSIHHYGGIGTFLALVLIALMALIMGLFHGVMAWLFVRFFGRQPLAFAALWAVQEWLKTWLLTGFPWLFVGYAYSDLPFVVSLAPMIGVLGISFLSVLLSAGFVEWYRRKAGFLLLGMLGVLGGVLLYGLNIAFTQPTGKQLSLSLVQGNIPQEIKWSMAHQQDILATYAQLSQNEWGQDLVIWPEAAVPLFQDEAAQFLQALSAVAQKNHSSFVTGIPYKEAAPANASSYPPFYNAVLALGNADGVYKKQHLVPFGEYVPLRGVLNILPNLAGHKNLLHEIISHSAGSARQKPLNIAGIPMGVAICYEVAYPETVRQNSKNSEFLLTVSNDTWFGTSTGPHQHLQMVRMRSLENGKWFVRATNSGITAIIDDKGRVREHLPQFIPGVLRGTVVLMSGQTPYSRLGDYPLLALLGLLLALSAWAKYSSRYAKDSKYWQDIH